MQDSRVWSSIRLLPLNLVSQIAPIVNVKCLERQLAPDSVSSHYLFLPYCGLHPNPLGILLFIHMDGYNREVVLYKHKLVQEIIMAVGLY